VSNPFLDILKNPPVAAPPAHWAMKVIEEFCAAIRDYRPGALGCELVLGHPTNQGQEYRVVITSLRTEYDYTLLRAYVPVGVSAGPVRVDFYDFTVRDFPDERQLEEGLKDFLGKPTTRAAIDEYAR
jgi:hypothetical protein